MVDRRNDRPLGVFPASTEERSPVVARGEIEIAASPDVVWDVLTDFARWPEWNPEVKSMKSSGPADMGTTFRWRAGPGTITSTIQRSEPPRQITWAGTTLGLKALHHWHLEPREGRTIVWEEESYDGLVARVFRLPLQKYLDRSLRNGRQHLKTEAERRATRSDLDREGVNS